MAPLAARQFRVNPRRSRLLEVFMAIALLGPVAMIGLAMFNFEMLDKLRLTPLMLASILLVPVVVVASVWMERRRARSAWLRVDGDGIEMHSANPAVLGGSWKVRWDEIAQVSFLDSFGVVQIRRRRFGSGPLALRVTEWMEDLPGAQPGPTSPRAMRTTALWKALEDAGLFKGHEVDPRVEALNFDLAKHPGTRAVLILMGALAAYWAIDGYFAREAWAEWKLRYVMPHIMVGMGAAALCGFVLGFYRKPRPIPRSAIGGLAMVLGMAAGVASWVGLIRVNQAFGGPLEAHAYVRNQKCDTLLPVEDGLPPIEYTGMAKGYWCQFPIDRRHTVLVRKGLGGLYQVDLTEHTHAIREFRQGAKK